jgi:peptidoglycan/LPS O-acetylase OafA/YrhL
VKRIPSLDGLRAISILLVVFGHLAHRLHGPSFFWENYPNIGVRIFYVISGYLITHILLKEKQRSGAISLRDFYVRRAFRIFPAALVFLVIVTAFNWSWLHWYHIAAAFLYLANFDFTRPWIYAHLWSLSVEEQFYFLWPSVLKRWYKQALVILVGVIVFTPCYELGLYFVKAQAQHFYTFPAVADNLAVGCLLAIVAQRLPRVPGYAAVAMFLVVALTPFFSAHSVGRTFFLVLVLRPAMQFSIAGVLLHVVQSPPRFLNFSLVSWLGRISYSLYLWQQPFCNAPYAHNGYVVLLAIVFACLSYYLVEQPMLRMRESRAGKAAPEVGPGELQATAA